MSSKKTAYFHKQAAKIVYKILKKKEKFIYHEI